MQKFILIRKILFIILIIIYSIAFSMPVFAHGTYLMGYSRWDFSKDKVTAVLDLDSALLDQIKQAKDGNMKFDSIPSGNLKQNADKIIQPYLDQNLSVWINDKKYSLKITGIERYEASHYKISLVIDSIALNIGTNTVKIEYKMFFDETGDIHANVATFISRDLSVSDSEYVFSSTDSTWEGTLKEPDTAKNNLNNLPPDGKTGSAKSKTNTSGRNSFWGIAGQFILLGIKHILTGYDHILFLLALVVIGLSFREVLRIISSFTIAHSITLLLAALNIVRLNPRFVEPAIALSICYVSLENILRQEAKQRWIVTFCFGLVHGFGFASILQEFVIERSNLIYSVVSFNIGVEIGQLSIFLIILPVLYLLKKKFVFRNITVYVSAFVFILGFFWFVERVFGF